MAKKTLIYDFSALKGKVTFSEPKPAIPETKPSVMSTSVTTVKETPLKVGQSVVLMDSDLRGRIVSIGRKVGVELEDGLLIEAAYEEETDKVTTAGGITIKGKNDPEVVKVLHINRYIS